jgi:hypothetical protein
MRAIACLALLAASACSLDWSTTPLGDASAESSSDAAVDDAPAEAADCTSLATTLASARLAAKKCATGPNVCTATMTDECGCTINVANATSPEDTAYQQAITAFKDAQCTPTCNACVTPSPGLCEVGPNLVTYCMPL